MLKLPIRNIVKAYICSWETTSNSSKFIVQNVEIMSQFEIIRVGFISEYPSISVVEKTKGQNNEIKKNFLCIEAF